MIPKFFFDTADVHYIKKVWDELGKYVPSNAILGITTNPNALNKIECHTLKDLEKTIPKISETLYDICGCGVVYVQVPNSLMLTADILRWAKYIKQFNFGGTKIGIKIPHLTYALELTPGLVKIGVEINVTGIADWATLLKAFSYKPVTYASLIPGRMEEVGINAEEHMEYIQHLPRGDHQAIISGSMRTILGLKSAIKRNTIPTIGSRVFDEVLKNPQEFLSYWDHSCMSLKYGYVHSPLVTEANVKLSESFFSQMDILGRKMYEEFTGDYSYDPIV